MLVWLISLSFTRGQKSWTSPNCELIKYGQSTLLWIKNHSKLFLTLSSFTMLSEYDANLDLCCRITPIICQVKSTLYTTTVRCSVCALDLFGSPSLTKLFLLSLNLKVSYNIFVLLLLIFKCHDKFPKPPRLVRCTAFTNKSHFGLLAVRCLKKL